MDRVSFAVNQTSGLERPQGVEHVTANNIWQRHLTYHKFIDVPDAHSNVLDYCSRP